jgi:signal transduction histidine kinase
LFNPFIERRMRLVEPVDAVDAAAAYAAPPGGASLASELIARAAAIGAGKPRSSGPALLPRDLRAALGACEVRARRLAAGWGEGAAIDFLGDAVAALAVDHRFEPGEARPAVVAAAAELGLPPETVVFAVFRRALTSQEFAQLPPVVAAELALALLVELAPAAAGSLWVLDAAGSTTCLVGHGCAPCSRRLREVARAALDGVIAGSAQVRVRIVERWDRPYAALVVRTRCSEAGQLDDYLAEAALALAPVLERAAIYDQKAQREHELVAASERRLLRLGFDLHDGPLQELVALAEELRLAAEQVSRIVPDEYRTRVTGRFADLHARLGSLDDSLREVAHSVRATTATARPVEEAVGAELRSLERATGIECLFRVEGDLSDLSDSQKIVLFRVVQEALSNVRKHSGARRVTVAIRCTRTFVSLSVADDGCGFDPGQPAGDRLGLAGISERVRLLGGVVELETAPGAGTTVRATLPQWRPSISVGSAVYAAAS